MTEEILSIPSVTVSLAFLLELREFLTSCYLTYSQDHDEARELSTKIDSILSNYKL